MHCTCMFSEVYYSYCQHSIVTHFSEGQCVLSGIQYTTTFVICIHFTALLCTVLCTYV